MGAEGGNFVVFVLLTQLAAVKRAPPCLFVSSSRDISALFRSEPVAPLRRSLCRYTGVFTIQFVFAVKIQFYFYFNQPSIKRLINLNISQF